MLKALLDYLVRSVVRKPEEVRIKHIETAKVDIFYLSVDKSDLGRLLGKKGRTVEAIRRVISAVGAKLGKETVIDVVE
jgi:hypothetical protein